MSTHLLSSSPIILYLISYNFAGLVIYKVKVTSDSVQVVNIISIWTQDVCSGLELWVVTNQVSDYGCGLWLQDFQDRRSTCSDILHTTCGLSSRHIQERFGFSLGLLSATLKE